MSDHHLLTAAADVVQRAAVSGAPAPEVDYDAGPLAMSVAGIDGVCKDVGKIIAQHASAVVEVLATHYLLRVIQENRDNAEQAGLVFERSIDSGIISSHCSDGARLASMLNLLVKQLSITRNLECRRVIMQCIGEIGAMDTAIVSNREPYLASRSRPVDRRCKFKTPDFPRNIHTMVALLLDDFLVPIFWHRVKNRAALRHGIIASASSFRNSLASVGAREIPPHVHQSLLRTAPTKTAL